MHDDLMRQITSARLGDFSEEEKKRKMKAVEAQLLQIRGHDRIDTSERATTSAVELRRSQTSPDDAKHRPMSPVGQMPDLPPRSKATTWTNWARNNHCEPALKVCVE